MGQFRDALRSVTASDHRTEVTVKIGDTSADLYAKPLTGADVDFVTRKHKGFFENPTVAGMVDLIVRKAKVQDTGDPAFDAGDKADLMRQPVEWIGGLYGKLFPSEDVDLSDEKIEDEVKN